ncbi:MAG TPA: amino acid permease [Vicinamibacterales bacterium]|nr:amino acid permease [Vicinamibacterales bacterium]
MADLRRSLTLFDVTMIAIGGTIGSGIFLTPALVAAALPSPAWILVAWLLGGLMALAGALTFSELAALMPRAGGQYVYLKEAYGSLVGFLFGWAYFLVVNAGGLGALSLAFATYFGYFVPLGPDGSKAVAILGLLALTMVNVVGVKAGAIFSDVFTVLKLVGIGGLAVVGLAWGSRETSDFSNLAIPGGLGGALATAMVGVLWSTGGWQHATYASGEVRNPRRTLPLAMTLGTAAVTVIYLSVNIAYLFLLSPAEMAASPRVAADAVSRVLGPAGGTLISLAIFVSTFGVVGIYTLTAPRIYFAMANDGVFFRRVAEVHPRFRTPAFAILAQSSWAVVLILFWGTFENLISYVVFTDWIFFGLAAGSVFVFRRRMPDAPRPVRVPLYPWTPAFFVAVSAWFVAVTLVERPAQAWAGIAFLALGVPAYYSWKRRRV